MAFLTTHLQRTGDHGRLRFHPECPICHCERLSGAFSAQAIVTRRGQALLAASVLAIASATPTAAVATEPDQEKEGTTPAEQVVINDASSAPDFDTDGPITELPHEAGPAPDDSFETDGLAAPLEPAPATDETAPAPDPSEESGIEIVEPQPQPPASEPLTQPPAAEPVAAESPSALSAPEPPAVTRHEPQVESTESREADEQPTPACELEHAEPPATARAMPPQPDPVAVAGVGGGSATVRVAQPTATHRQVGRRDDRFHVVQRGESLWSIARDLLGDDASVARIALEVNRLWELNSARIGTGEPDLLLAGTRIALR